MGFYLNLPLIFLKFWFFEGPKSLILFFASLNNAFMQMFSLPLLVKTFFKPWKNEYREGLVAFSIGIGMFIKSLFIFADLLLFTILLSIEIFIVLLFVLMPVITVDLLIL